MGALRIAIGAAIGATLVACAKFSAPEDSAAIGEDGGGPDAGANTADANASDANEGDAADADAGCPPETCVGRTSCELSDFPPGCGDWQTSGDVGAFHDCKNGSLRIKADNTLDAVATRTVPAPIGQYSLRIAARIVLNAWDDNEVIRVDFDSTTFAMLVAGRKFGTTIPLTFCRTSGQCSSQQVPIEAGTEHLFALEIGPMGTKVTIDCVPLVQDNPVALPTSAELHISIGHLDGAPIDGTFDDFVIQFR